MTLLITILAIPLLLTLASLLIKQVKLVSWCNTLGMLLLGYLVSVLIIQVKTQNTFLISDSFILDPLSLFSLVLVTTVALLVSLYSHSYSHSLLAQGLIQTKTINYYYTFFNFFVLSMLAVSVMNNIGWVWIGIECSTLTSALLLGLYSKTINLEAAWKYLVLCTVGIIIALLGIVFFVTSITNAGDYNIFSLVNLSNCDFVFNHRVLKIAFVLIFLGYGTKIGLVPLHTWMPDAYSKADAPVSAILTASLAPIVLIPILRFKYIVDIALGSCDFTNNLFYFFGFLSLLLAAIFLVNQFDYKRLLAYSSIENMGFVLIAIALDSPVTLMAALFHIVFHSLTKTGLFLYTGNLFLVYHSTKIDDVRNSIKKLPYTSFLITITIFALTGMPPFALFISKFMILRELITDNLVASIIVLLCFAMVFGSLIHYFNKMIFYLPDKEECDQEFSFQSPFFNTLAITLPVLTVLFLGLYLPESFVRFVQEAAMTISVGSKIP